MRHGGMAVEVSGFCKAGRHHTLPFSFRLIPQPNPHHNIWIVQRLMLGAALQGWACLWWQNLFEVGFGFGVLFASQPYSLYTRTILTSPIRHFSEHSCTFPA